MSNPIHAFLKKTAITTGFLSLDGIIHAGVGSTAAALATFNPAVGAVFGAGYFLASHTVYCIENLIEKTDCNPFSENTQGKLFKVAVAFFSGMTGGVAACAAFSIPVTLSAAILLTGLMIGTTLMVGILIYSHFYISDLAVGENLFPKPSRGS